MANKTAFGTMESSFIERHLSNHSTTAASFASVGRIDFNKSGTACDSFVFQTTNKIIPSSVANMFSESVSLKHTSNIQVFNSNETVFIDELSASFVNEITSLITDFQISSTEQISCFNSISTALLFSAQSTMQELQSLLTFNQMSGVGDEFVVAQGSEVLQAEIDADFFSTGMNDFSVGYFANKDCVPLSSTILLDCESLYLTFRGPMQFDWDVSDLAQIQSFVGQEFETTLRESDAVHTALKSWKTFLFTGFIFDTTKEVTESFVNSVTDILGNLRMNRIFAFDKLVVIKLPQSLTSIFIGLGGDVKKVIVNGLTNFQRFNYIMFLSVRRIQSILIHSELHEKEEIIIIYKSCFDLTSGYLKLLDRS